MHMPTLLLRFGRRGFNRCLCVRLLGGLLLGGGGELPQQQSEGGGRRGAALVLPSGIVGGVGALSGAAGGGGRVEQSREGVGRGADPGGGHVGEHLQRGGGARLGFTLFIYICI